MLQYRTFKTIILRQVELNKICWKIFKKVNYHRIGDGDIMLNFFPGFQLATGNKGRYLYVFDKTGSQSAPGRHSAIASGINIV